MSDPQGAPAPTIDEEEPVQRFLPCAYCQQRTATDAPGARYFRARDPQFEPVDHAVEESVICARCLKAEARCIATESARVEQIFPD